MILQEFFGILVSSTHDLQDEQDLIPKEVRLFITRRSGMMETQDEIIFKIANTSQEFEDAKDLFLQYAESLDVDLSFQHFADELKTIEQQYNKPSGALLLAYKDGK